MQVERPALLALVRRLYNADMYYVYLLKNLKSASIYYGFTSNLERRLEEHNSDQSPYTRGKGDWEIIYYEAYKSKIDALFREKMLKHHGSTFGHLKKRISNSLNEN